ncbi:DUF6291 domain-containing protein [Myroides odoratimimus]|uniref:DUF6291 domain-containing protein n=1 Tax=Myroides odoratimimus TaxID=76832 RepID=UPI002575DF74|nr:DUF6291 domain-containing protein [Myroides odoratimimus]MDM1499080.1 hypothetical protein [Myroides odoratimimus]
MAEDKKSFVGYSDWISTFDMLSNEEAGKLIKHLLAYVNDKNPEDLEDRVLKVAFEPIKNQLKRDLKKYDKIRLKRIEAGKLGGQQRSKNQANKASATNAKQNQANQAVNGNVNDNVTVNGNVNDILLEKETKGDINQNEKIEEFNSTDLYTEETFQKKVAPKKRFSIPTIEEIQEYCFERNNQVNPEKFFDHYESNGWQVGKAKMKDWKAAIRTWEKNNFNNQNQNQNGQQQERFIGRQSIDTIQHNATAGYEAAERVRKQMLNNSD